MWAIILCKTYSIFAGKQNELLFQISLGIFNQSLKDSNLISITVHMPLGGIIMRVCQLVLLLGLLLCMGAQLSDGQHWSHGWYPGGKRELDPFSTSEVRMFLCLPVV